MKTITEFLFLPGPALFAAITLFVGLCTVTPDIGYAQTEQSEEATSSSEFSEGSPTSEGGSGTENDQLIETGSLELSEPVVSASEFFPRGRGGESILVIGTGPVSGSFYAVGGAICRAVNKGTERHNIFCVVKPTEGSHDNLQLLADKRIDLAFVQSDWQFYAYKGLADFSETGAQTDLRHVMALHNHPLFLIVSPTNEAFSLVDLKGQRVNLGPMGSGQRAFAEVALSVVGLNNKDLAYAGDLGPTQQLDALCKGEIDAFIVSAPNPSGLIRAATNGCGARIAEFGTGVFKALLEENPYLHALVIPSGMYRNTPVDIESFAVVTTLVSRQDVPGATVHEIVSSVLKQLPDFKAQHAVLNFLDAREISTIGQTAPLHEGAEVSFREEGLPAGAVLQ